MHRRQLLGGALGAGIAFKSAIGSGFQGQGGGSQDVFIERDQPGTPHKGKVLAAIQPHADDIPLFAAGTVAKLLREGYTGYLIRTTNDECAGPGSLGETVLANERDNNEVARVMGFKQVFDLNCRNHRMDGDSALELRSRMIFLFRLLKVDTVVCYDPWGHYEENPDHYMTAACVEAACWMAAGNKDYPEHFAAGLEPHAVREKYYFARGPQLVTRVVDIGSSIEDKIDAMLANQAQGPAGNSGARLRASLAARKLKLPVLGDDDKTANRQYIRHFLLKRDEETGRKYGLKYAEQFHYIGMENPDAIQVFIQQNAVPL
jgi:LmbE family N-acetylglucosaminyl deacetylase